MRELIDVILNEYEELSIEYNGLYSEFAELSDDYVLLSDKYEELQDINDELDSENETLVAEFNEAMVIIDNKDTEIELLEEGIVFLESDVAEARTVVDFLKADVSDLERHLEVALDENERLVEAITDHTENEEYLEAKLDDCDEEISSLLIEDEASQDRIYELVEENEELTDEIGNLQETIDRYEDMIDRYEQDLAEREEERPPKGAFEF